MVKSKKIYTPQSYLELMTGNTYLFRQEDTVAEIEEILEEYFDDPIWSYDLTEIDHIVENNLNVVLVDCSGFYGKNEITPYFRWFEVFDEFEDERIKVYEVTIEEVISEKFTIYAPDIQSALEKAEEKYWNGDIVLEPGNVTGRRMMVTDVESVDMSDWTDF